MATLTISQNCLDLIKKWEGFVPVAKPCPAGYPTFGYGSIRHADGRPVKNGDEISKAEAEELLKSECDDFTDIVNQCVTVPLTQNQFDALVSFTYNVGGAALQGSTLLKKLNAQDYSGAAEEFLRWNKITQNGVKIPLEGLTNRRKEEKALFEKQGAEGTPLPKAEPSPQSQVTWLEGYREADSDNTIVVARNGSTVIEILVIESAAKADLIAVLNQYPNANNFLLAPPGRAVPAGERIVVQDRGTATVTPIPADEVPSLQNSLLAVGMGLEDEAPASLIEDIKNLQRRLMALGYYSGEIDGKFGTGTDGAVRTFQGTAFGQGEVDGKVGPKTWEKLWGQDLQKPEPPSPIPSGKTYLKLTKTNRKDRNGLYVLKLEYIKNGRLEDSLSVISGAPSRQAFRTGPNSRPGSLEPLPEGQWRIEDIKWADGKDNYTGKTFAVSGNGVGPVSVPLTYIGPKNTGRSAIEIHIDWNSGNGHRAPGTAGCVGLYTIADYQRFVRWLRDTDPKDFYVDWDLGTCPQP